VELLLEGAQDLREALEDWADEEHPPHPEWHVHITDSEGRELTIAAEAPRRFVIENANPS